jgi:superfamily II DNA/RNA helicase
MGFIPDIERIVNLIPFTRQTLFFSATMPPEIQILADKFLQNPVRVEVSTRSSTATTVTQRLVAAGAKDYDKRAKLRDIVRAETELKNAIIFCNRKKDVADLFRSLDRHNFSVGALHGDMDQRSRTTMLHNFREGQLQLLVASDVAARGLDIPDVSHVFNFDVPIHAEDYVHRIGRTGRAGRSGKAFTLVTKRDAKYVSAIETLIDKKLEWLDGDVSSLPEAEETDEAPRRGAREGGRSSGRGGRTRAASGRSRAPKGDDAAPRIQAEKDSATPPEAAAPDVVAQVPAPQIVAEVERPHHAANDDRRDNRRPAPQRDERPRHAERAPDRSRQRDRRGDDGPTPVGFGDDIPAFMMIAAKA